METNMEIRTALITGASSGIGAAFARQLAASGCRLILVARRTERLNELAAEIVETTQVPAESLEIISTDLADLQSLESLRKLISQRDDIDLLINNAGFGLRGAFGGSDLEKHLNMVRVHVMASMTLIHAILPGMISRRHGYIINTSSIAAFMPSPGNTSYTSTKACLNMFSEALQGEVRRSGIFVQALCPGLTRTEFHEVMGSGPVNRPSWIWMTPDQVVTASLKSLTKGKVIVVPGFQNQVLSFLLHIPFLVKLILNRVEAGMENTPNTGQPD